MELDVLEVHLRHLKHITAVGKEHIPSLTVFRHILVLTLLERFQFGRIVAFNPAGLVQAHRFPAALGIVFVLQTVLDDFELERPDRADDLAAVERGYEQLRHAFVHELIDAFGQLLEFQRVGVLDVAELLGGERRDAREFELLALGEGVADLEVARIVQADDVARVGEVDDRFLFGHEGRRRGELELLAAAYVQVVMVALERPGADFQEGDAVAVVGIHVGVDLEHEARHLRLGGLHGAGRGGRRARRGGDADEAFEQFAHAEVVDRRTEEDRGQFAPQVGPAVEIVLDTFDQLPVRAQLFGEFRADVAVQLRRREVGNLGGLGVGGEFFVRREKREVLFVEVVDPAERGAVRNGEGQRPHADAQFLFHLVQQVERLLGGAVEFVDEDDHRRRTHTAHLHQFAGLRLDALGAVDDDDDRIDGRQRAVGVFGEVLVSRGVEDVDLGALVFEAHDGSGHGDASLALDLHEVRRGAFLDLVAFDRPGDVDGPAEEQQLLGEGGFTRVGVGDDREGAAACDFFL